MNVQQAYDVWANNYDQVENKTRDLEAKALRASISTSALLNILEIGCGTGKNTEWLLIRAKQLVAVDFSAEMLVRAKEKITANNVEFKELDLRNDWEFSENRFDLITCSLALEHIQNINFVFEQAEKALRIGGFFYIGELHPFKQYQGSKARFDSADGVFELECFTHHISEFFAAAKDNDFECLDLTEWFDDDDRTTVPRLLTMIFRTKM